MRRVWFLVVFSTSIFCMSVMAEDASPWDSHATGWHWYVDPVKEAPLKVQQTQSAPSMPVTPLKQLEQLQQQLKTAKALAVLYPTKANVLHYIVLQNAITQNASQFARVWATLIWQHPELNYQLSHPTNQAALAAYHEKQQHDENKQLNQAAKQFGLWFFFSGTCPYCKRFAPTVKRVASQYHFALLPISIDGLSLPPFPHPVMNHGQAQALKVTKWPALYMVSPSKRLIIPVTFGMISEEDLKTRLATLYQEARQREKVS